MFDVLEDGNAIMIDIPEEELRVMDMHDIHRSVYDKYYEKEIIMVKIRLTEERWSTVSNEETINQKRLNLLHA